MADEVSYNPDLFQVTDAGDLAVKAEVRKWPYPGVSLSQGNGLKYDANGLFVDVPPTVSLLSEIWNAVDGAGPVDIASAASGTLPIPQVGLAAFTKDAVVVGGWHLTCWYTLDDAATAEGYVTLKLTDKALPLNAVSAVGNTRQGLVRHCAAFIPVERDVAGGQAFTTAVAAQINNQTGGPVTVDFRAHFSAYVMEGVTF
ncbi:hypothetical protein [Streptomyces sp. cg35]|uniref:hypothetical protein n=1 Tax=Streptomyces sp. cg35 TaxID=3421650 RepID=UPI003D166DCE